MLITATIYLSIINSFVWTVSCDSCPCVSLILNACIRWLLAIDLTNRSFIFHRFASAIFITLKPTELEDHKVSGCTYMHVQCTTGEGPFIPLPMSTSTIHRRRPIYMCVYITCLNCTAFRSYPTLVLSLFMLLLLQC